MMNRRQFLKNTAIAAAAAALPAPVLGEEPAPATKPPVNILFLYTDEQRFDTLVPKLMPNLCKLAEQSTVFERTYVTQPVCTPSRGSLVSGLYPHQHGAWTNNMFLRRDALCLPEMLPAGKYVCGHFGKWHLGDEIFAQHGFTDWRGTEDTYHKTYSPPVEEFGPERSTYHHWLVKKGIKPNPPPPVNPHPATVNRFFRDQIHHLPEEACRPAFLSEQAIEFITTNRAKPWALFVNFLEPHPPFHSCRDKQFAPADVTLAPNWQKPLAAGAPLRLRLGAQAGGVPEVELRDTTARYWGMCNLVDAHVGRILDALNQTGQRDNTIIVFTSDHGEMLGSFGLFGKGAMLEESARVPMLIQLPGQRQPRRVACPVGHIDVIPTLLDLAGQPVPARLPGRSWRPLLEGKATKTDRDVFIEWINPRPTGAPKPLKGDKAKLCTPEQAQAANGEQVRSIVTADGWKLNWSSGGDHELFDLNTDPHETTNLVRTTAQKARVADLQKRIVAWQQQMGDTEKLLPVL